MEYIYNKMSDYIIIVNDKGIISFCNKSFLNKFNYQNEDILNSNINKIINNEDIYNILNQSKEIDTVLKIYSNNNELINIKCNISKLNSSNETIIIGKQINSKPYTMEMLEDILDKMDTITFVLDNEERYLYANKALENLYNKKREDIIGTYNSDYWDEDMYKAIKKNNEEIIKMKSPKIFNEEFKIGNNRYLLESYKSAVFDKDENFKYIVGTTKNISLDRILSEELYKNYNSLIYKNGIRGFVNSQKYFKSVLNDICKSVLDYTNANRVTIWIYNKEEEYTESKLTLDASGKFFNNESRIPLNNEDLILLDKNNGFNIMLPVEQIDDKYITDDYKNMSYYGAYKIEIDDEFIGSVGISYTNDNKPKFNCDEYMSHICNRIGMIIKVSQISQERDIENKKRRDSENELEQYLNISVDIVAKVGRNGVLKNISPSCYNTLGWNKEELINTYLGNIIHPEDVDNFKHRDINKHQDGTLNRHISRLKHKNGHYIYLEWSSIYLKDEQLYITTARDITKKLEMEKEMKILEEAVKLESVKNEFLSNMSHEFRTPINIILGTMQVLNKNIENNNIEIDSLRRYSNYIKQNSYRLLRLVNNLIDINKMDVGSYKLNCYNNDIVSLVEDITLSVSDYIKGNNINLIFDTNIEEVVTNSDPDKIERIMLNLLSNAIKYTNDDGLIEVKLHGEKDKVVVSVKDSGIGIPKENLDSIFDRFSQVDDSLNRICEGSGIGLSLVKNLVEMHGGNIYVNSKVNEGSEFTFSIPITLGKDIDINSEERKLKHVERCNIEFSDIYN